MSVTIRTKPNGPYVVEGDFTIIDENGKEQQPLKKSLCRCGGSTTKPYCDGTHSKIGFQGATAAVESSRE